MEPVNMCISLILSLRWGHFFTAFIIFLCSLASSLRVIHVMCCWACIWLSMHMVILKDKRNLCITIFPRLEKWLEIKSVYWSYRGPESGSQHPCQVAYNIHNSSYRVWHPSFCNWHSLEYTQNTIIKNGKINLGKNLSNSKHTLKPWVEIGGNVNICFILRIYL